MNRRLASNLLSVFSISLVALAAIAPQTITPALAAQETATLKIAFLDLQLAIEETEEGQRDFAVVQKYVEQKNQELRALQKESQALQEQLQIQGGKLTLEAQSDLEYQVQAKSTELQRFQQDTQLDIDNRRVRVSNRIASKMIPIIEQISRLKGLQAVFYKNPSRDGWVDPSLDITAEIISAYDKAFPVSSKTPAASPASTP